MPVAAADAKPDWWLLCRVGERLCGLPLDGVIETMRPLPVEPLAQAPRFVLGLGVIRGSAVAIVDGGALLGAPGSRSERWVTIGAGGRTTALAVDRVLGVREIGPDAMATLPPLLGDAAREHITAVGTLDTELLLFLRAARIVSDTLVEGLGPPEAAS